MVLAIAAVLAPLLILLGLKYGTIETMRERLIARADGLARIYAPLQFVTYVELYQEGQAVTARNWAGSQPRPFLSFDGAFVIHPARLSCIKMRMLTINTGLAQINKINSDHKFICRC